MSVFVENIALQIQEIRNKIKVLKENNENTMELEVKLSSLLKDLSEANDHSSKTLLKG